MLGFLKITAANMVAFAVISIVNVVIIPLLIRHYGIEQYGLIVLARVILPAGMLAILDIGFTEATTKHVAHAIAHGDRAGAGRAICTSLLFVIPIAAVLSITAIVAPSIVSTYFLGVSQAHVEFFDIVFWTGIGLLVAFPGLVAEGAIRGLERFDLIRLLDVVACLVYGGGAVAMIAYGLPYTSVAYLYLVSVAARSLVMIILIHVPGSPLWLPLGWPRAAESREQIVVAWRVFQGKILSAIFNLSAPLLISHALSASAVGIFDAIMRLPHFVKSVVGLVNAAVLPVTVRMEVTAGQAQVHALLSMATRLSITFLGIPLAVVSLFGTEIVSLWLGSGYASYGPWFGLVVLWPLAFTITGIGVSMLVARSDALPMLNGLSVVQIALYILIGLGLIRFLHERAFFVATVAAIWMVLPFQLWLVARTFNLSLWVYADIMGRFVLAALPAVVISTLFWQLGSGLVMNATAFLLSLVGSLTAAVLLLSRPSEREIGMRFVWQTLGRQAKA